MRFLVIFNRRSLKMDLPPRSDFYLNREKKGVEYYEVLCTINSIVLYCLPLAIFHCLLVSVSILRFK